MNLGKIGFNQFKAYQEYKQEYEQEYKQEYKQKNQHIGKGIGIFDFVEFVKKPLPSDLYKTQVFRETDPKSFSSFRTSHWKEIYTKVKENNFFGFGPMGDRLIINNTASSLFFYSLASGGIFGLIFILFLSFRSLYLVIYFIFLEKKNSFSKNDIIHFSCLILVVIYLRGILETSFGIFSIDYCIFILPLLLIEYRYKNLKKKFY